MNKLIKEDRVDISSQLRIPGRCDVGGILLAKVQIVSLVRPHELEQHITWFKHAIEDLKVYYLEALTSQPGAHDTKAVQRRFWQETEMGAALLRFFHQYQDSGDRGLQYIARIIAPREAIGGDTGPVTEERAQ